MSGGWIKFWKATPTDPYVLAAAEQLSQRYNPPLPFSLARNAVTGALATLWSYADEHIRDDDTLPLTLQSIDAIVGLECFFELMPRAWLDKLDDGRIVLTGYCEKNSLVARRERTVKSNARVTRWRRAQASKRNGVTTKHGTEFITAGDSDKDQDEDKQLRNQSVSARSRCNPIRVSHETLSDDWWLDFKLTYPARSGDQNWARAKRAAAARMREGHTPEQFVTGKDRYAAYCRATNKIGTEYVKQACTFLGPDKPFMERWDVPATKAETRQGRNISAAEQWLQEQEGNDASH